MIFCKIFNHFYRRSRNYLESITILFRFLLNFSGRKFVSLENYPDFVAQLHKTENLKILRYFSKSIWKFSKYLEFFSIFVRKNRFFLPNCWKFWKLDSFSNFDSGAWRSDPQGVWSGSPGGVGSKCGIVNLPIVCFLLQFFGPPLGVSDFRTLQRVSTPLCPCMVSGVTTRGCQVQGDIQGVPRKHYFWTFGDIWNK